MMRYEVYWKNSEGVMGSLKEIKVRIASIRSTQKITAAMKMVSSAKFHHAQTQTEHTLTYANKLSAILNGLLSAECDLDSPYTEQRKVSKVAIAVFASSTGLCGTFNANIWKELSATIQTYKNQQIEVRLYPIGKKIADELHKADYSFDTDFITIGENRLMKAPYPWRTVSWSCSSQVKQTGWNYCITISRTWRHKS